MLEALKALYRSLGGLTATAALKIIPEIKKKKDTGEKTRNGKPPLPRVGLVEKTENTLKIGGRLNG